MNRAFWGDERDRKDYNTDAIRGIIYQFPEIVKAYLDTIDVHVTNSRVNQSAGYVHSSRGMIFHFECRADEKDFVHFKDFSNYISTDQYPKIDYNAVTSGFVDGSSWSDFTCFSKETIVTFSFEVPVDNLQDIDNFMHMLKTKTQTIAYRKFSEKMDEEISQELGE